MKVRKARLSDGRQVAKVHILSGKSAFSGVLPDYEITEETFTAAENDLKIKIKEAVSGKTCFFVAEAKEQICGYTQGGDSIEEHGPAEEYPAELYNIFILDQFQGKGIGNKLFLKAVNWFIKKDKKALMLSVIEKTKAESYYLKLGGIKVFEREEEVIDRTVKLVTYGWKDINKLKRNLEKK